LLLPSLSYVVSGERLHFSSKETDLMRPAGKLYPFVLGCLFAGASFAQTLVSVATPIDPVATAKYQTLRTRVVGNDLALDWDEFRKVAVDAGLERGYDWHPIRERVLSSLAAGNTKLALSGAQAVIAHNMANPEGHLLAMTVYQQMGQDAAAEHERTLLEAIVHSIMSTGDGLSAQRAISTVSSGEEEFVVDMVLDGDTESRSTVRAEGQAYDLRRIRSEDGSEHTLWFHTNTPPRTLALARIPRR
jgi:hypothetical protein